MTPRRRDGLMALAVLVAVALYLAPALLPGRVLLPLDIVATRWPPWQDAGEAAAVHNPLISDPVAYMVPIRHFAVSSLRGGDWPLWNPQTLGGTPFTYNTQAGLFYPLSLLFYLLPLPAAWDAVILLQMVLGGLFMQAYLRRLGVARAAAVFGAWLFLFNGVMVVWLEWQVVHAAVVWLPLQLWLVERLLAAPDAPAARRAALAAGVAVALPWLNGHWNWTLYLSLLLGAYLLWRGVGLWRGGNKTLPPGRMALLLLPVLVGIGLAAVQIVPAVVYLAQSHRAPFTWAEAQARGLGRIPAILFVPDFYGHPVAQTWHGPPEMNYNEATAYVGVLPWLLAALALWRRRDGMTRFWGAVLVVGLLWTLGTPAYRLLHALPVFDGLFPSRAAVLVSVSAAVLAAFGLDQLMATRKMRGDGAVVALVAGGMAAVVVGTVGVIRPNLAPLRPDLLTFAALLVGSLVIVAGRRVGRLSPAALAAAALLWLAVDLGQFGLGYNTIGRTADFYPPTAVDRFLQAQPGPLRIASLPQGEAYPPNASLMAGIANLSGYEPGVPANVVAYLDAAEGGPTIRFDRKLLPLDAVASPLLDALNVRYIVTTGDRFGTTAQPVAPAPAVAAWYPLTPDSAVGQSLTVPDAGLQRIDVPVQPGDGTLTLRVLSRDAAYEFAHATVDVATVSDGTASFAVTPFPSEWGRDFYVSLEADAPVALGRSADGPLALQAFYLPRPDLVFEDGRTRVYANPGAFARAWVVGQAEVADSAESALTAVVAAQDALDRRVIIEPGRTPLPDWAPTDPAAAGVPGSVRVDAVSNNRLRLHAELDAPGYVVVADNFYPGWRARVDGAPAPLYRANAVMRAVPLPAGSHTVEMVFRPPDFFAGAAVSAVTLLGVGVALAADRRRRP